MDEKKRFYAYYKMIKICQKKNILITEIKGSRCTFEFMENSGKDEKSISVHTHNRHSKE